MESSNTKSPKQGCSSLLLFVLSVSMLGAACGCDWMGQGSSRMKVRYYISMLNNTGRELNGVSVYYEDKMAAMAGYMPKRGYAGYGPIVTPYPSQAEVRWIDEGVPHAVNVQLLGVVSPEFYKTQGELYFIIEADRTVTVKDARFHDFNANLKIQNEVQRPDLAEH